MEVVDALLEFWVAGKIVEPLEIKSLFLRFEGFKEFSGTADMSKVSLERMQSGMIRLAFAALGIFGCSKING